MKIIELGVLHLNLMREGTNLVVLPGVGGDNGLLAKSVWFATFLACFLQISDSSKDNMSGGW